jgi:hypothetical protein
VVELAVYLCPQPLRRRRRILAALLRRPKLLEQLLQDPGQRRPALRRWPAGDAAARPGLITAGAIRFQIEGRDDWTLHAGDAFPEPAATRMAHFDNVSETAPASFVVFYLLAPGEDRLIEILDTGQGSKAAQ